MPTVKAEFRENRPAMSTTMTLLEQTIAERARAHLAGVQAFYAKAKAGTAVEDALLELRHWRDSGMSDAGRDALLSVEIEAAKALRDYCA